MATVPGGQAEGAQLAWGTETPNCKDLPGPYTSKLLAVPSCGRPRDALPWNAFGQRCLNITVLGTYRAVCVRALLYIRALAIVTKMLSLSFLMPFVLHLPLSDVSSSSAFFSFACMSVPSFCFYSGHFGFWSIDNKGSIVCLPEYCKCLFTE